MVYDGLEVVMREVGEAFRVVVGNEVQSGIGFSREPEGIVVTTEAVARGEGLEVRYQVSVARHRLHRSSGEASAVDVFLDGQFLRNATAHTSPTGWELRFPDAGRHVLVRGTGTAPTNVDLARWEPGYRPGA